MNAIRILLTVYALATVWPVSALAQRYDTSFVNNTNTPPSLLKLEKSNPSQEQTLPPRINLVSRQEHVIRSNLQYSLDWNERIKSNQLAKGGGGVVDGGGGNESKKVLLDEVIAGGTTLLNSEELKNKIESVWKTRFNIFENTFPGFRLFLYAGFKSKWIVDSRFSSEEFCKNHTLHKLEQDIVACQSLMSVNFQEKWLAESSSDPQRQIKIFIHELIRFHVIRLGKIESLSQHAQDDIVANITVKILDPNTSGKEIYDLIVKNKILKTEGEIFTTRLREYTSMVNSVKDLLIARYELRKMEISVDEKLIKAFANAVESNQKALDLHIYYCDTLFAEEELFENGFKKCSEIAKKWDSL